MIFEKLAALLAEQFSVDVDSITAVGAHVRHAVFGPGTVESVAGRRVTVRFTAGPRTLDAQVVAERHLMWAE